MCECVSKQAGEQASADCLREKEHVNELLGGVDEREPRKPKQPMRLFQRALIRRKRSREIKCES